MVTTIFKEGGAKEEELDFSKLSDARIHQLMKEEYWKQSELLIDEKNVEKEA